MPEDQALATIRADSPFRSLYLLALIDATKRPQIHGHPLPRLRDQTALQIAPVLTKEMMCLMQDLAGSDEPVLWPALLSRARAHDYFALLKRLEEVATKEWLAVQQRVAPLIPGGMPAEEYFCGDI